MAFDNDVYTRENGPRSTRSMVNKLRKLIAKKNDEIRKWKIQCQQEKVLREYEQARNDALQNELSETQAKADALEEQVNCQGEFY